MKSIKIVSKILFYVARILAIFYLLTSLYVLLTTSLKTSSLVFLEESRFAINFPFTQQNFLLGSEFTLAYVSEMILGIGVYGLFFWVLSDVFKAFMQERLFTHQGILYLKRFYLFNLIFYPVFAIIWSMISREDFPFLAMVVAHAIMGVFILFMYAIFEQGVHLQNEQDLYI